MNVDIDYDFEYSDDSMESLSDHFRLFSFQRVNDKTNIDDELSEMIEFLGEMGYKTSAMTNDAIVSMYDEIMGA
jgi:hypothetical protein